MSLRHGSRGMGQGGGGGRVYERLRATLMRRLNGGLAVLNTYARMRYGKDFVELLLEEPDEAMELAERTMKNPVIKRVLQHYLNTTFREGVDVSVNVFPRAVARTSLVLAAV